LLLDGAVSFVAILVIRDMIEMRRTCAGFASENSLATVPVRRLQFNPLSRAVSIKAKLF